VENPINLNAFDFHQKISSDDKAIIIDVRTAQEFNEGHIQNSLLIDIYNPNFQSKILELDKTKRYYIYCRSGNRSFHAGVLMLSKGFTSVHHLEEGIISWSEKLER
jgi:rhodanese-related sulfurtransferase